MLNKAILSTLLKLVLNSCRQMISGWSFKMLSATSVLISLLVSLFWVRPLKLCTFQSITRIFSSCFFLVNPDPACQANTTSNCCQPKQRLKKGNQATTGFTINQKIKAKNKSNTKYGTIKPVNPFNHQFAGFT